MEPRGRTTSAVLTALVAAAGLELGDAMTFVAMAIRSTTLPGGPELAVLAALVGPRLVFAALCVHTARRVAAGDEGVALAAVGLLALLAVQAAAGLFLLWGVGATVTGRLTLGGLAAVTAVAAANVYWPGSLRRRVRPEPEGDHPG